MYRNVLSGVISSGNAAFRAIKKIFMSVMLGQFVGHSIAGVFSDFFCVCVFVVSDGIKNSAADYNSTPYGVGVGVVVVVVVVV